MKRVHIKKMTPNDFAFAIRLTDTVNWDLTERDFKFMTALEPEGCFTLWDGAERVGMATTAHFGRIGWIGNVIVDQRHHSRGFGALLVKHAIGYLTKRSVTTIGLYAYLDTVRFYEKLGFKASSNFTHLVRQGSNVHSKQESAKAMTRLDLQKTIFLDEQCVGWNREKLLKNIFKDSRDLCYVARDSDEIVGFIMADWYRQEIGPWVCRPNHDDEAVRLLEAVLSKLSDIEVRMGVSETSRKVSDELKKLRFQEEFKVVRMYHGEPTKDHDCLLAMESLERG